MNDPCDCEHGGVRSRGRCEGTPPQMVDRNCCEVRLHIESEFPLPAATSLTLGLQASAKVCVTVLPSLNTPPATASERPLSERQPLATLRRLAARHRGDVLMECADDATMSRQVNSRRSFVPTLGYPKARGLPNSHPAWSRAGRRPFGQELRAEQTVPSLQWMGHVGVRPPVARRKKARSHGIIPQKGDANHTAEVTPARHHLCPGPSNTVPISKFGHYPLTE